MIIGLVIVFGIIAGLLSYIIYGSGYGLRWDVALGVFGSVISSSIMAAAYVFNYIGKENIIGLNWYSVSIELIGAFVFIYGGLLFRNIRPFLHIEKLIYFWRAYPA